MLNDADDRSAPRKEKNGVERDQDRYDTGSRERVGGGGKHAAKGSGNKISISQQSQTVTGYLPKMYININNNTKRATVASRSLYGGSYFRNYS